MIDQTIAHFRITAKLGEGGMGTVYRAEDSKLGRAVALKFLPEAFVADAERMARFTREAQMLASLNHPNIAGIYSVEEAPGEGSDVPRRFLVMELVEGETLQDRIDRGPLELSEALQITLQIATGLEEAHERGIIHRDLKPANIKWTPAKQVKILDFGLAKAFDPDSQTGSMPSGPGGSGQRLALSPTMTGMATQMGMLLGTAAYMSPEQARGEPVDRRADIWALGVVLTEMLTGKVLHRGKTVSDTLASVLARDPAWEELPADTPRPIRSLLERCLEKDSRARLRDVGEARIAIERFLADPTAEEVEQSQSQAAVAGAMPEPTWRRALPWAVAALLAGALGVTAFVMRPEPAPPAQSLRLNLELPADESLFTGYGSSAVLSPDGTQLAFILGSGNQHTLNLQSLDQWEGTLLVEGDGVSRPYQPFFSPDGHWIGYVTPGEMRKVPVTGGTSIKLCDLDRARGASWGADGTIVFSGSPSSPLLQVPDTGGEPRPLTELDKEKGDMSHRWPQWLPGGRAVLFTSHRRASEFDEANIEVYDLDSGERTIVLQGGTYGRYIQTEPGSGFVIYANAGSLFAIPFDHERLEVTGPAAPAIEDVTFGGTEGSAQYSTSGDGKLAYGSGAAGILGHTVVWVDRDGKIEPLWEDQQYYRNPSLSPDGSRLALDILTEGQSDIWLYDIDRGVPTRLTFSDLDDHFPVWSPDGEYVYYAAEVDSSTAIFRKLADGSGDREEMLRLEGRTIPGSITPDGQLLAFTTETGGQNWNIGTIRLSEANAEPQMLLTSTFVEYGPKFSPDGRWYAYFSDESGNVEVYVRSVDGRGKWQISNGGGYWPRWSPDGKELFFWLGTALFAADVELTGGSFRAGRAEQLFDGPFADLGSADVSDVSPDGQRVLTFQNLTPVSTDSHQHVKLVLNWDEELKRRR